MIGVYPAENIGIISADEKGLIKIWSDDLQQLKTKIFVNFLYATSFAQLGNKLFFGAKQGCNIK